MPVVFSQAEKKWRLEKLPAEGTGDIIEEVIGAKRQQRTASSITDLFYPVPQNFERDQKDWQNCIKHSKVVAEAVRYINQSLRRKAYVLETSAQSGINNINMTADILDSLVRQGIVYRQEIDNLELYWHTDVHVKPIASTDVTYSSHDKYVKLARKISSFNP